MRDSITPTDAVIIATSATDDPGLVCMAPGGCKSMIRVNGQAAVAHLVENLKLSDLVSRVVLVSDRKTSDAAPGYDVFVEAGATEAECVIAGMRAVADSPRCIIMTGDMPLASPEAVTDFLTHAPDSDVVYPVVERSDVKEAFPSRKASYVKTKEGMFTGSSCLAVVPNVALSKEKLIIDLLHARKSPRALLGLIGPVVAMKIMFSTLALSEFERYLSDALRVNCRVFVSHYPELLISIDTVSDVRLIEEVLNE